MKYILILFLFVFSSSCGQTEIVSTPIDSIHLSILKWNQLGTSHRKNNNKEKALFHHNNALKMARKYGLYEDQIHSLMGIADVLRTDDAEQSIKHLKVALQIADSIGQQQLSAEIYQSLSEIYHEQANYKQALEALKQHHLLADQMIQKDKDQKIILIQKTFQRNGIFFVALMILILLVILYLYFRKTRKLNTQLHNSNQIKDKLFTIIGHDLRNPIGNINDVLALIEQNQMTVHEQNQLIKQIREQGEGSLEILDSLLLWGQAQLKGITIHPVSFHPSAMIEKNRSILQGKLNEKRLELQNNIPKDLQLIADQDHFDFIIRNLLSNAIKFSHDRGLIAVEAKYVFGPDFIVISVKDQGIGISQDQQKAFLSGNLDISFGTGGEKGTGIGLMLSKQFQIANGGKIWIESTIGEDTTFYLSYPMPSA